MDSSGDIDVRVLQRQVRTLRAHATISSTLLIVVVLAAFTGTWRREKFDEIDVQRINLVEPDGRLDMVIANRARMPDPIVGGRTFERSSASSPGILFYNDEGDENGGLSFHGGLRDGKPSASGGLLFDRFHQDQTVGLVYSEGDGRYIAGLRVWERPDVSVSELYDRIVAVQKMTNQTEKVRAVEALRDSGLVGVQRVFVGQGEGRAAAVVLSDRQGRPRITMQVDSTGTPTLEFLDDRGQVVYRIPELAAGKTR